MKIDNTCYFCKTNKALFRSNDGYWFCGEEACLENLKKKQMKDFIDSNKDVFKDMIKEVLTENANN